MEAMNPKKRIHHATAAERNAVENVFFRATEILGCSPDTFHITSRRADYDRTNRDFLMHYIYQTSGMTNTQIGKLFDVSYSAVSHRIKKITEMFDEDMGLRRRYEKFSLEMDASLNLEGSPVFPGAAQNSLNDDSRIRYDRNDGDATGHQQEKSRKMRKRLIQATLDCLEEYGYHGSSLSRILDRADVSRGAWRHHFDSKRDLVIAAARQSYAEAAGKSKEIKQMFAKQENPLADMLDYTWHNFHQGKYRNVWLEFTVASRTDRELNNKLKPIIDDFFSVLDEMIEAAFEKTDVSPAPAKNLMNLTLFLTRGMAIQSITHEAPDYYKKLRALWLEILSPLVKI